MIQYRLCTKSIALEPRNISRPDRRERRNRLSRAISLVLLCIASFSFATPKDILVHRDGTRVEGTITHETATKIVIQTEKYGELHFEKLDLVTIDRGRDREARETSVPKATPTPYDYSVFIPEGPVNALAPPVQIPVIVNLIARGITPPAKPTTISASTPSETQNSEVSAPPVATPSASALTAPTATQAVGAVTALRGIAQLMRDTEPKSLKIGATLHKGDRLETGLDAAVVLRLQTGHKIALGPRTIAKIKQVSNTGGCLIELEQGLLWCDVSTAAPTKLFTLEVTDCIITPEPADLDKGATVKVALLGDNKLFVGSLKGKLLFYQSGKQYRTFLGQLPVIYDRAQGSVTEMPQLLEQLQTEWQQVQ